MVVIVMIGIITLLGVPSLLTYWQSARLGASADELAGVLAQARGLAIRQNTTVCVQRTGTNLQFVIPDCGGAVWTGVGTDSAGVFRLSNGIQITGGGPATFAGNGGATAAPAANLVFRITDPTNARTRDITLATSGRVTW
jgi:Tfp pilus assembly protein FimT